MLVRRWFADLGLAILLALPIATLALPLPNNSNRSTSVPVAAKTASADRIASTGRISLLG